MLFSSSLFAQNDLCEKFITKMVNSVEQKNVAEAKAYMKGFVNCKEEGLDNNSQKRKNINAISFITSYDREIALVDMKEDNGLDYDYALMDKDLNIIPLRYDFVWSYFSEELLLVKNDKKYGYVNKKGQLIIPLKYDQALNFQDGYGVVKLDGKWGFVNKLGKEIPLIYDQVFPFEDGKALVKQNEKRFYINTSGDFVKSFP